MVLVDKHSCVDFYCNGLTQNYDCTAARKAPAAKPAASKAAASQAGAKRKPAAKAPGASTAARKPADEPQEDSYAFDNDVPEVADSPAMAVPKVR